MYRKFTVGETKTTTLFQEARTCIYRESMLKEKEINQPSAEKKIELNRNV